MRKKKIEKRTREYADIKKKGKDKQDKHVNRRMKKTKTEMYQKYTKLRGNID